MDLYFVMVNIVIFPISQNNFGENKAIIVNMKNVQMYGNKKYPLKSCNAR